MVRAGWPLHALAETFRDINRRVCVETWFIYRLTSRDHLAAAAERLVPADLHALMQQCHQVRRSGQGLSADKRQALFAAFFRWEQAEIVGPGVEQAFAAFDWTIARRLALKPRVAFAYLPASLPFRDFADTDERVDKGLAAFAGGECVGWDPGGTVVVRLRHNARRVRARPPPRTSARCYTASLTCSSRPPCKERDHGRQRPHHPVRRAVRTVFG